MASSARSQPGVAAGCDVRIDTASLAPGAECDQRYRADGGRESRVEGAGVQHATGHGERLLPPERAVLNTIPAGIAHEGLGPDHRRPRALAAANEGPLQRREPQWAVGKTLRIEHCRRSAGRARREGDRQVVRSGRGRDDRARCVEDHRYHHALALPGARRAEQQHRVLHRRPAPDAAARPDAISQISGTRAL